MDERRVDLGRVGARRAVDRDRDREDFRRRADHGAAGDDEGGDAPRFGAHVGRPRIIDEPDAEAEDDRQAEIDDEPQRQELVDAEPREDEARDHRADDADDRADDPGGK